MLKIKVRLNKNEDYETFFYLDCKFNFKSVKEALQDKLKSYYNLTKEQIKNLGIPEEYSTTSVSFYVDPAPSKKGKKTMCKK